MQQATRPFSEQIDNNLEQDISSEHQYFSFIVRQQEYAVDILRVVEIRGWNGAREVPGLPAYMKGVIDLRGEVVPIVDLRERFGMTSLKYDHLTVVVILKVNGERGNKTIGIIVDAVSDVYTIYSNQLKPAPDFGGEIDMNYVTNLATVNEKMIVLLDVDELLGKQMPSHVEIRIDDNDEVQVTEEEQPDATTLLETSFQALAPKGEKLVRRFYQELFKRHPAVKPMFANSNQSEQEKKLLTALQLVVNNLRKPEKLTNALHALGEKHQAYGAEPAHYDAVAAVLLDVMQELAGPLWSEQIHTAWADALGTIKQAMLSAYRDGEPKKPVHKAVEKKGTNDTTRLLETSFEAIAPRAEQMAGYFYQQLFSRYPAVKPLFTGTDMTGQRKKLVAALNLVVSNLRKPAKLERALKELGARHQAYGAIESHYDAVANVLVDALKEHAGNSWNREHSQAWRNALGSIKEMMLSGYNEGLSSQQIGVLESSFSLLAPHADELVARFYASLFQRYPAVKPMFAKANPKEQKKKLIAALKLVVSSLRNPVKLATALKELGRKHQHYGALPTHYDAVSTTLLDSMADLAGDSWTNEVNEAWEAALKTVKDLMLGGYTK
ncbi:MAG: globin domain-containing protein [Gammaproteobacteria bacterium]|nr:globin domain-containing protein [Gammaproteobacteria bacterium]MDH5651743.1 globin domain-containing protein [Gammaproteobacteria bacterium]